MFLLVLAPHLAPLLFLASLFAVNAWACWLGIVVGGGKVVTLFDQSWSFLLGIITRRPWRV